MGGSIRSAAWEGGGTTACGSVVGVEGGERGNSHLDIEEFTDKFGFCVCPDGL